MQAAEDSTNEDFFLETKYQQTQQTCIFSNAESFMESFITSVCWREGWLPGVLVLSEGLLVKFKFA